MVMCRDQEVPEEFIVPHLNSQYCEMAFRELRSLTTVNHTAVNFTIKQVEQRMRTVQMKLFIAHRNKHEIAFPSLRKEEQKALDTETFALPSDSEIATAIDKAQQKALDLLRSIGCAVEELNFTNSIRIPDPDIQFEFVSVQCDG